MVGLGKMNGIMLSRSASHVYYRELGEGRWRGEFDFRITDFKRFFSQKLSPTDRFLGVLLHTVQRLPGEARMFGEIRMDPDEGEAGVARVEVFVERFGFEIYWLSGHYALSPNGRDVDINILERFGPRGSPIERYKPARGEIKNDGWIGTYFMPILGENWEGLYTLDASRRELDAEYTCPWGVSREAMHRRVPVVPQGGPERLRYERLLRVARRLERLARRYDNSSDRRASFTDAYALITRNFAYQLAQEPFEQPEWVVSLAEHFAQLYCAATEGADRGLAPPAWQRTFALIQSKELTVLDAFLLSMFTHVSHDLPQAALRAGLRDPLGQSHVNDFHRANKVLAEAIDPIQERIARRYMPLAAVLDTLAFDFDEKITQRALTYARTQAWYDAERLSELAARGATTTEIEARIDQFQHKLLGENSVARWTLSGLRRVARKLEPQPKNPSPAKEHFGKRTQLPERPAPPLARLYGVHSALGVQKHQGNLEALAETARAWADRLLLQPLEVKSLVSDLVDLLPFDRLLDDPSADRFALAALAKDAVSADALPQTLARLQIEPPQHQSILNYQSALQTYLADFADAAQSSLIGACAALDSAGIPATSVLASFDDVRAHYDQDTQIFTAEIATVFRTKFEVIAPLLNPDVWDNYIDQLEVADFIAPLLQGKAVLREVFNFFPPWMPEHPLRFVNDLDIEIRSEPGYLFTTYALAKSYDGAMLLDDGEMEARALGDYTYLRFKKVLKIGNHPLLFGMLRFNPDGLAWMLSYWIEEGAKRRLAEVEKKTPG